MGDPIGFGCPIVNDAGEFVECSCSTVSNRVRFEPDFYGDINDIPEVGSRDIRACWAHGHAYAIVRGQETGTAYVCRDDGIMVKFGVTSGNQSVGIMAMPFGVLAVYVMPGGKYAKWSLTPELETIAAVTLEQPSELAPGTSQGFLWLEKDGTPGWTDLNRTVSFRPEGWDHTLTLVLPMSASSLIVGQRAADPPQVTIYDTAEMEPLTVWHGATSFPPQLAVAPDGRAMVGIAAGGNAVFVSSPFGPYVPPQPPQPPVDPHTPPSSPIVTFPGYKPPPQASYGRKGYCGPYFATDLRAGNFTTPGNTEMIVNGTVLGGNQQVNRPVFVGLASVGNDPAKMLGLLGGANDDSMANHALLASWAWHVTHGHPNSLMVRYYDGAPVPKSFLDECEEDAVIQFPCYPRQGESLKASMARFTEAADRIIGSGRKCGIARAFNTKFGGLQAVLDIQAPLCEMVRQRPQIILDAWFSHARWYAGVESGAAYCAELLAWEEVLGGLFTGLP